MTYYKPKKKRSGLLIIGLVLIGGGVAFNQVLKNRPHDPEDKKSQNPAFSYLDDHIQKLKSLNPEQDSLIALSLARKLKQKGEYLESADYFQIALKGPWTETQRYDLELELTDILSKLGNQAEAEAILARLQQQNPNKAAAFNREGLLKEALDALAIAEEKYKQAVNAEPTAVNSYDNLARVLKKQEKPDANEILKLAIKQTKNDPDAYLQLIESLVSENKIEQAQKILDDAKNQLTHKPSDLLIMESVLDHSKGDHAEAEKKLSDALHLSPKNKKAKHYLAREQLHQNENQSLKSYQEAMELDPSNAQLVDEYRKAFDKLNNQMQAGQIPEQQGEKINLASLDDHAQNRDFSSDGFSSEGAETFDNNNQGQNGNQFGDNNQGQNGNQFGSNNQGQNGNQFGSNNQGQNGNQPGSNNLGQNGNQPGSNNLGQNGNQPGNNNQGQNGNQPGSNNQGQNGNQLGKNSAGEATPGTSPQKTAKNDRESAGDNQPELDRNGIDLDALERKAKQRFLAGNYTEAKKIFDLIYSYENNRKGIHYFLGRSNHMLGNTKQAFKYYDIAKKDKTFKAKSLYYSGRLYLENKNYRKSISALKQAIQLEPLNTGWMNSLAVAHEKNKNFKKAIRLYEKSLVIKDGQPVALLQKGMLERKTGAYRDATNSFEQVLSKEPLNKDAWLYSGENYLDLKKYSKAQSAFRNLLAIEPGNFNGNYNLLYSFLVKKDAANGLAFFQGLPRKLKENEKFLFLAGSLSEQQGSYQKATKFYKQSTNRNPKYFQAWLNMGNTLKKQNKFNEAAGSYEEAKKLKPRSLEPKKNLALLYEKNKKWDQARNEWLSLIRLKPANLDYRLAYAENLEKSGLFRAAQKQYQSILKHKTTQPQAMERLGFLYYRDLDEPQEALQTFLHLLKNHPSHPRKQEIRKIIEYLKQG